MEKELFRQRQEKENDQVLQACQKELTKIQNHQKIELEKKSREHDEAMRKLRKQRMSHNEHQMKAFINCQKKEYKHNKEVAKAVCFISIFSQKAHPTLSKLFKIRILFFRA